MWFSSDPWLACSGVFDQGCSKTLHGSVPLGYDLIPSKFSLLNTENNKQIHRNCTAYMMHNTYSICMQVNSISCRAFCNIHIWGWSLYSGSLLSSCGLTEKLKQSKQKMYIHKRQEMCVALGSQKQYIVIHTYKSLFLLITKNKGLFEILHFGPLTKE